MAIRFSQPILLATDPEIDDLSFTINTVPSWATVGETGLVSGTPLQANVGFDGNDFSFTVTDGNGGIAIQTFTLFVQNVNDDPTFTTTPITTAQTGTVYTYTPLFSDEDGDVPIVDLSLSTVPSWITFNPTNGTFSGTPQQSDIGLVDNDLIIAISDGIGGTATQTVAINVANGNQNPFFTSTPPLTANEDTLFTYQISVDDPDGDVVELELDVPDWINVDETGLLTGTPLQSDVSEVANQFSFTATDGKGGTATQSFTLNVLNVNDDPTFDAIPAPSLAATEGVLYSYTPTFDDEDGDITTVDLANSVIPSWLTFDASTGTFSGTPAQADEGVETVTIAISDGIGGTATRTFDVTVTTVNDAPIAGDDTVAGNEDTPLILSTLLDNDSDPDLNTLSIDSVTQATNGSVTLNGDGTVTYTPNDDFNGEDTFTYTVSDGTLVAVDSATVAVIVAPANDDPTGEVTITGDVRIGGLLTANVALMDKDGLGPFSYEWSRTVGDDDITLLSTAGTYTLTEGDAGAITVKVSYTDLDGTEEEVTSAPILYDADPTIFGTPNADTLQGTSGADTINALGDNDILNGGAGIDLLIGGTGDDIYGVNETGDIVQELPDEGLDTIFSDVNYTLPDNVEGLFLLGPDDLTGTGNDQQNAIIGNEGDNLLVGLAGDDVLSGLEGADTLAGGDGDNTLAGGEGDDLYVITSLTDVVVELENEGIDQIQSFTNVILLPDNVEVLYLFGADDLTGTGNDQNNLIIGNAGDNLLVGLGGDDVLRGLGGADTLVGGASVDILSGGVGNDLYGGAGNDLYVVTSPTDTVFEQVNEGVDTVESTLDIVLSDNVEIAVLTGSDDVGATGNALSNFLSGNDADNALFGGAGADTLAGGDGDNTLAGGEGDDLYVITSLTDVVVELENEGIDEIESGTNVILGDHIENITFFGDEVASGLGNALDNVIIGNDASNALFGAAGADTLEGRGGRDVLYDGDGIDLLIGGDGNDFYVVGADTMLDTNGDVVLDQDGNIISDVIIENADEGIDTVFSYAQEFVLPDHVENLILTSVFSLVEAAQKNIDTVAVAAVPGVNDIRAPSFGDVDPKELLKLEQSNLYDIAADASGTGNALNNQITGDLFKNALSGLDGADTLDGGQGRDTLSGGEGADLFRYTDFSDGGVSLFGSSENITDFVVGEDKIDLSQLVLSAGSAASNSIIGGLQTSGFSFLGEVTSTGRAGDITTLRSGDLTLVTVESGSTTKPDLVFFVTSDAALSATDFRFEAEEVVVITPSPADLIPTPADAPEGTRSVGFRADMSPLALGLESGFTGSYRLDVPEDADYFIADNFNGFGAIRLAVNYEAVDPTSPPPAEFTTSNAWSLALNYDLGGGATVQPWILGGSFGLTDTEDEPPFFPELGARFRFLTQDGQDESLILDIDRDLDGVKDFELELINVDENTQFRTERVNGSLNISIYDGNSGPTGKLTIDGTPRVFENLTANADNLYDRDGIVQSTVTFQWLNNGVAIEGATENEYRARLSDVGDFINVQMTYTDVFGTQETVLSETFQPIGVASQAAQGEVGITGTLRQGETISVDISDITDRDIPDPRTAAYQWQRDGVDIADANGFTYTLTQEDVGAQINVVYDFSDLGGDRETKVSALTAAVENVNDAPRGTITLGGLLQVGSTVRADADLFDLDGIDLFVAQTYQWFRDGTAIAGETSQIYRVTTDDIQEELSVRVGFTDGFGTPEFVTSTGFEVPLQGIRTIGTPASELLEGSIGADQLFGTSGNDTLIGGASDDLLRGGSGSDTAVYSGNQSSYTVTLSAQGVTVEDRRSDAQGGEGTDTMTDMNFLDFGQEIPEFAGGPMGLDLYAQLPGVSPEEFTAFVELYIAYFNRAPDAIGLFFWGSVLQLPDWDLERIAVEGFFPQEETQATYPDLTDIEGFAKKVYTNVLGRDFDQEGLDFWVGVLEGGFVSLPKFMLQIIEGAKVAPQPGASEEFIAQQAIDVAYLANKAELGTYFSVIKGMSNVENSRAVMNLYDGSQASIDAAKASTDDFYADALDAENGEFLFSLAGVVDDPFAIF